MQHLHNFTSPSEIKPELTGVLFTKDKAVATDSFRLCEARHDFDIDAPIIVHLPHKRKLTNVISDDEGARVVDTKGEESVASTTHADKFPKYEMIKRSDDDMPEAEVVLNVKYLKEMAQFIEKNGVDDFTGVRVKLYSDGGPVVFEDAEDKESAQGMIMPMTR